MHTTLVDTVANNFGVKLLDSVTIQTTSGRWLTGRLISFGLDSAGSPYAISLKPADGRIRGIPMSAIEWMSKTD